MNDMFVWREVKLLFHVLRRVMHFVRLLACACELCERGKEKEKRPKQTNKFK
jgi:hypothetical protein